MIGWLLETMFAATLLMLLVLALRRPAAFFFGAGWAYALWLLPVLRIVLPPLHLFGSGIPSLPMPVPAVVPSGAAVASLAYDAPPIDWEPLMLAVWIGGAALILLWQGWSYIAFARRLLIGSMLHAPLARDIGILESPEVDGPLAIGLIDRWIVVPADFATRYTPQEQRLALLHEHTHHRRQDIFCNMIALAVLALNWFNPVAYFAFRAFRADQELSCDAVVAARASREERHDYALALVKSSSRPGLIAACPLNHAGQLKQRLRMMKAHRSTRLRALGGLSAVTIIALAGISATETASIAAPAAVLPSAAPAAPVPSLSPEYLPPVIQPARPAAAAVPVSRKPKRIAAPKPAARVAMAEAEAAATEPPSPPAVEEAPEPAAQSRMHFVVVRTRTGAFAEQAHHLPAVRELRMVRMDRPLPGAIRERLEAMLARQSQLSPAIPVRMIELKDIGEN